MRSKFLLSIITCLSVSFVACSQTTLFVALNGNDQHTGTQQRPFATLDKAKLAARGIKGKVIVYVRGGTYYITAPIVFSPEDARAANNEIVYKPFRNEKVILSGAVLLDLKWEDFTHGIKSATVNENLIFDALFLNGKPQRMARYPNFNPSKSHFGGTADDAISPERVAKWSDPRGGYVHALHRHEWGDFHYLITGKNERNEISLEGGFQNNRQMGMHEKYRFVENIFEELDTAGEWYYSQQQKKLYYMPDGEPGSAKVELPQLKHLIEFRGSESSPVTNITVQGFVLTQTVRTFMSTKEPLLRSDWTIYRGGAVVMEGAGNCRIIDCKIQDTGGNAIFFSNYNRNNEVAGCEITRIGASAISFVGDPAAVRSPSFEYNKFVPLKDLDRRPGPQSNNYPENCKVFDNLIHDIGQTEKQVAGVEISMSRSILVSHNTIYTTPRAGINISEGTWGGHMIEFNDVFNTVLETGDHGAFNSWGRDRYWHPNYDTLTSITTNHPELILLDAMDPVVLRNNRFRCDHGWDIDLDDGSSNYHIYNNVCLNGGLKLREGFYRVVENNIIINNSFHPHVWFKNSGDVFRYNIVSRNYYPIRLQGWGKEVDFNLFPDEISLLKASEERTDMNSVYGDPMFVAPDRGDYRVAANSPALKIGFRNFDMNIFGVVSPALKSKAQSPPLPEIISNTDVQDNRYEWMGTTIKNLNTLGERSATGMASTTGVLVLEVATWSAWANDLKAGDVILNYDHRPVRNIEDLERAFMMTKEGNDIDMIVFRNQQEIKTTVRATR